MSSTADESKERFARTVYAFPEVGFTPTVTLNDFPAVVATVVGASVIDDANAAMGRIRALSVNVEIIFFIAIGIG